MTHFWNERYSAHMYAYGKEPNVFFKEWIEKLDPGSILMPADGEGRNGVFAAKLGWQVTSFDLSIEGQKKALALAEANGVTINFIVGDVGALEFEKESFDALGLIYAHFPADTKSASHKKLTEYLKPGGIVILEAFSKNHLSFNTLDPNVGGPKDIDMLFSTAELIDDFPDFDIIVLEDKRLTLTEGKYHNGKGAVVQFVGAK